MWQNKYVEYLSGQVNMFDELEILLARLQKKRSKCFSGVISNQI